MVDFKVYPQKIPSALVDRVIRNHADFKKSSWSIFRAQGTTGFEKPLIDEHGNQCNSVQNPHLLGFSKQFRSSIEEIIFHRIVSECLTDFTGHKDHVHYQSMFFDKSTGTKRHQDTWYLDTQPAGNLVGIWFALEDIDIDAGPFCLYRNAAQSKLEPDQFDFDDLDNDARFKLSFPNSERFDFQARKGDILIWKSFTVHGALLPVSDNKTRKSITSHYYPKGSSVLDAPIKRMFSIYDHQTPKQTSNPSLQKAGVINPYVYQSMCIALEKSKRLKNISSRDHSADKRLSEIRNIKY